MDITLKGLTKVKNTCFWIEMEKGVTIVIVYKLPKSFEKHYFFKDVCAKRRYLSSDFAWKTSYKKGIFFSIWHISAHNMKDVYDCFGINLLIFLSYPLATYGIAQVFISGTYAIMHVHLHVNTHTHEIRIIDPRFLLPGNRRKERNNQ